MKPMEIKQLRASAKRLRAEADRLEAMAKKAEAGSVKPNVGKYTTSGKLKVKTAPKKSMAGSSQYSWDKTRDQWYDKINKRWMPKGEARRRGLTTGG